MWWAQRAPKRAKDDVRTGSFLSNKEHQKVDSRESGVKRDAETGHLTTARLYCLSSRLVQCFCVQSFSLEGLSRRSPPGRMAPMNDSERLSRLRHDLSNPLSALLAETQLLLLNESQIDPETLTGLREIEALAIRMRTMLREI